MPSSQDIGERLLHNRLVTDAPELTSWLESFLAQRGAIAGTIHTRAAQDEQLHLRAAVRIPLKVQEITRLIPKGKGMAGLAWERGVPVTTCDLQEGGNEDVRPGARAVQAHAAVAIPVQGQDGELRAVVGIAFSDEREFDNADLKAMTVAAATLP